MPRYLLPVLQALATVAILVWIFGDAKVRSDVGGVWKMLDLRWAVAGLAAAGLNEAAGVLRWWCCLHLAGLPVGLRRAGALHFMGLFATLFLPGSAGGDAVKIACLAVEFPQRRIGGALAALMDRLSGLVVITLTAGVIASFRREWFEQTPATASLFRGVMIFLAVAVSGLILWGISSHPCIRHRHPRWLPFRERIIEITGIFDTFFSSGSRALATFVLSFVTFSSLVLTYYCAARALAVPVALADLYSVMPVIDVVTMLPITLSGIGLREKAFETMLAALCGVPAGSAVLISLTGFGLLACWSLLGAPVFMLYRAQRLPEAAHV